MKSLTKTLLLPPTVSAAEENYLQRANRTATIFFAAHLPVFCAVAWFNQTGVTLAFWLTLFTLAGPLMAMMLLQCQRQISVVMGVTSMLMGGLLVHFGQGPVQIEMHFYFFVLLALLAVYGNPLVIVAAAATVTLHHALLWLLLPSSVFNYSAPIWVVGVHAGFVVLESIAACYIARIFYDTTHRLEGTVAQRTLQYEQATHELQRLLDSVQQGFLTIDGNGIIGSRYSRAVVDLLGEIPASHSFRELLESTSKTTADWFDMALDDVFAGIMPWEVTIDQLPSRFESRQRTLSLKYHPIFEGDELTRLAITISDITADVQREKLELENREVLSMIDRMTKDRVGFIEFVSEASDLVTYLRNKDRLSLDSIKRAVHTLKGSSSVFGLYRIVNACHAIEDQIEETGELPYGAVWTELFSCWASTRGHLRRLTADTNWQITLGDEEFSEVLLDILNNAPKGDLAQRVAAWRLEPTKVRLQRIAEQTRSIGKRLGKPNLRVLTRDNGLRTDPKYWARFWTASVHVLRNAIDHGLEDVETRRLAGKPDEGEIRIETLAEHDTFTITIADDGRGIDWDRIRTAAEPVGLPAESETDLLDAMFSDGLTTRDHATDASGRGVGLSAIKEVCDALDGTISLQSSPGEGTEFKFCFPITAMAPEMHELLNKHGISEANYLTCHQ